MLVPPSTYIRSRPTAHTQLWVRPADALLMLWHPPVFRAFPDNWTANEVDVVRATLLLAYAAHSVSIVHGLDGFAHGVAEVVVFACMRPRRFATTGSPPSMTPSNFAKTNETREESLALSISSGCSATNVWSSRRTLIP